MIETFFYNSNNRIWLECVKCILHFKVKLFIKLSFGLHSTKIYRKMPKWEWKLMLLNTNSVNITFKEYRF